MCTIEAIYWLCKTLDPGGSFDDLLWYYAHIRNIIKQHGTARTRKNLECMDEATPQKIWNA